MWSKWYFHILLVRVLISTTLWKTIWHCLLKVTKSVSYDSTVLLLGIDMQTHGHQKRCQESLKQPYAYIIFLNGTSQMPMNNRMGT